MSRIIPIRKHLGDKRYIKAIVAGEPDTRKTSAIASFPGKKLWIDRDRKVEALTIPINLGFADDDIDVFVPDRAKQVLDILDVYVKQGPECEYQNIVIDSFTTLIETELRAIAHKKARQAQSTVSYTHLTLPTTPYV